MDKLENKVEIIITRDYCEQVAVRLFTDQEWEVLASEVEGMINHYLEMELTSIIDNLDEFVAEDVKASSQEPN